MALVVAAHVPEIAGHAQIRDAEHISRNHDALFSSNHQGGPRQRRASRLRSPREPVLVPNRSWRARHFAGSSKWAGSCIQAAVWRDGRAGAATGTSVTLRRPRALRLPAGAPGKRDLSTASVQFVIAQPPFDLARLVDAVAAQVDLVRSSRPRIRVTVSKHHTTSPVR